MEHVRIKSGSTDIICILDRSTSIRTSGLIGKTIEGFNAFLADQKKESGNAKLTLCLFDGDPTGSGAYGSVPGKSYEIVHERLNLEDVPDLNENTFVPRGMTAMYDAIGSTIDRVYNGWKNDENRSEKVIFLIMTDGQENASKEYNKSSVAKLIEQRKKEDNWVFLFIGANIDTMEVGGGLGVSRGNSLSYSNTDRGVTTAYANMSSSVKMFRSAAVKTTTSADGATLFCADINTDNLMADNGEDKENLDGNK